MSINKNLTRSLLLSSTIAGILSASAAFADSEAAEASATFDEVVVTANRVPTDVKEVLAPVTVITNEELRQSSVTDVSDALRYEAGIDVARTGGIGQPTSIFIRGAESNHTLVLIDGIRMSPGTIGLASIQNIPPELIERIEIVKGPRSTIYGSDAIGGVINIITRHRADGPYAEFQVGSGRWETRKVSGLFENGSEAVWGGFNASAIESESFPTKQNSTINNPYENVAVSAHLGAKLGEVTTTMRHVRAEGTAAYLGFFGNALDQDFTNELTALTIDANIVDAWSSKLTSSYMLDSIEQNQPANAPTRGFLDTRRTLLDWQNDFRFGDNVLVAGAMYSMENARTRGFTSFDVDTDVLNVYVQDQLKLDIHTVQVAAGLTDHETFGTKITWNAEYGIDFTDSSKLVAAVGTAFHAPDATDRFGFAGNVNLNPEDSRNIELSFRQELTDQQRASISAYQNDIKNLITYDGGLNLLRNIDRAQIRGIEVSYDIEGSSWRAHLAANFQEPKDRATDTLLLRRAKRSISGSFTQTFGDLNVGAYINAVGPRMDFGNVEMDSYVLAALSAEYEIVTGWSIAARVDNLFNEQYEVADGYNTADRSVFVSMKFATK